MSNTTRSGPMFSTLHPPTPPRTPRPPRAPSTAISVGTCPCASRRAPPWASTWINFRRGGAASTAPLPEDRPGSGSPTTRSRDGPWGCRGGAARRRGSSMGPIGGRPTRAKSGGSGGSSTRGVPAQAPPIDSPHPAQAVVKGVMVVAVVMLPRPHALQRHQHGRPQDLMEVVGPGGPHPHILLVTGTWGDYQAYNPLSDKPHLQGWTTLWKETAPNGHRRPPPNLQGVQAHIKSKAVTPRWTLHL